jgi:hypothetical protein
MGSARIAWYTGHQVDDLVILIAPTTGRLHQHMHRLAAIMNTASPARDRYEARRYVIGRRSSAARRDCLLQFFHDPVDHDG